VDLAAGRRPAEVHAREETVERPPGPAAREPRPRNEALDALLILRARSIPVWLSWLGVVASILGLIEFLLQMLDLLHGPATILPWIPMALFELLLGLWLLLKGVAVRSAPATHPTPAASVSP